MLRRAGGKGVLVAMATGALLAAGCSFVLTFDESQIPTDATDVGVDSGIDSGTSDSGTIDSGAIDSGEIDSSTSDSAADTSSPGDSAVVDSASDSGSTDSGSTADSGSDTGTAVVDSGIDSAMMDMGVSDAADASSTTPSTFAGCASADYAANDFTASPSTAAEIQFPVGGLQYSPKCIRVKAGQAVKWTAAGGATFADHPLRHAPTNPDGSKIPDQSTGTTFTETFTVTGFYGYYCNVHGDPSGAGMSGAIEVVP
jgi:plastocyanin